MRRAIGTSVAALIFAAMAAAAAASPGQAKSRFATEFGSTLPPIGFVRFCGLHPRECEHEAFSPHREKFNGETWSKLVDINSYVNSRVKPESDLKLYGEPEFWTYPVDAGDCEDYLLLKKRYLEGLGFAPEALLITVVLDESGEGHAVLTVVTDDGDYVLDNRRSDILRWGETGYRFVKRQSTRNARQWVALEQQKSPAANQLTSGNLR